MRCGSCGRDVGTIGGARFCPSCGAELAGALAGGDPWIGRMVAARYTIVSLLAEGGVGRVYVAEQAMGGTKRRVALKVLLPEHASDPEMVRRFSRECELLSLVEHPNVVRIYDFGEIEAGVFFIAMELVPGESLECVLREERALAPHRAAGVLAQIARAIATAHDHGVIHRDLKPGNVMIVRAEGEADFVKLLDFGIAKRVAGTGAADANVTRAGVVLGTPAYMSPEQFLGEAVDPRTDIYSLGVLAYETVTGALPFSAESMPEWATQHLTATPRAFDDTPFGGRVPSAMRQAIMHALAKAREDRPATMREVAAALTSAGSVVSKTIAGDAVPLSPSLPPAPRPPPPRARSRVPLLAALVAAGAGAATILAVVALRAPDASTASDAASDAASDGEAGPEDSSSSSVEAPVDATADASEEDAGDEQAGCRLALAAKTCGAARAAQRTCPDRAPLHDEVHRHVARLCGHGH